MIRRLLHLAFVTIAWIAGSWQGSLGKSTIDQHWTPPAGGAMLGLSRAVSGPRMAMFENHAP
jgi:hypothetical protein